MDHLGSLETKHKSYRYILAVIDDYTKFIWLYPTKTVATKEVIEKLEVQKNFFSNSSRIISDQGTAFISTDFENYCREEGIEHIKVTVSLPRANGQIERINKTIISVLAKMSLNKLTKWYKHVDRLQPILNSTFQRSIDTTPFELLIGTKIKKSILK